MNHEDQTARRYADRALSIARRCCTGMWEGVADKDAALGREAAKRNSEPPRRWRDPARCAAGARDEAVVVARMARKIRLSRKSRRHAKPDTVPANARSVMLGAVNRAAWMAEFAAM